MEELAAAVAVPGAVPPPLRPDEPGQEPADLLLLAALLPLHFRLPPRRLRRRLVLPPCRRRLRRRWRRLLISGGRHERLGEGGDVDEGGAGADDVDGADVRGERGVVRRRGRAAGGVRGRGRRGGGGPRGGGRRGGRGEVRQAVPEAVRADALGHPVLRVPLAPVLPL